VRGLVKPYVATAADTTKIELHVQRSAVGFEKDAILASISNSDVTFMPALSVRLARSLHRIESGAGGRERAPARARKRQP
jgi:hypothetical protein